MAVDLVCGKVVEGKHWIRAGVVRWVFEGDPYYFCSLACRRTFTADPTRFLTIAVPSSARLPVVPSPASSARLSVVPPADPTSSSRLSAVLASEPTSAERLAVVERASSARLTVVPAEAPATEPAKAKDESSDQ